MDTVSYLLGKKNGGGSGTTNYNDLSNKPSINDVTLSGNKTSSDLGVQSEIDSTHKLSADLVDDTNTTNKFVSASDKTTWSGKQDALVSGTNIKTVNSTSLLGSGDIEVQPTLVSGTNIKTINSQSILGSGDITISGGGSLPLFYSDTNYYIDIRNDITPGIYFNSSDNFYVFITNKVGNPDTLYCSFGFFVILKNYADADYNDIFIYYHNKDGKRVSLKKNTWNSGYDTQTATTGEWTSQSYVNDKPTTYAGYDATKTQVLKNINGTLTWVDE